MRCRPSAQPRPSTEGLESAGRALEPLVDATITVVVTVVAGGALAHRTRGLERAVRVAGRRSDFSADVPGSGVTVGCSATVRTRTGTPDIVGACMRAPAARRRVRTGLGRGSAAGVPGPVGDLIAGLRSRGAIAPLGRDGDAARPRGPAGRAGAGSALSARGARDGTRASIDADNFIILAGFDAGAAVVHRAGLADAGATDERGKPAVGGLCSGPGASGGSLDEENRQRDGNDEDQSMFHGPPPRLRVRWAADHSGACPVNDDGPNGLRRLGCPST